jgi:type IV pilus assembly protein PilC
MTRFSYTAEKSTGEVYKGVAEAPDRFELYSIVRHEGGKIVSVGEETGGTIWSMAYWNTKIAVVKEYDKVLMARNLGAMLGAGLSLGRALAVLERQTKNLKLVATIAQVASDVRRGDTLHQAMTKFPNIFSGLFVAMVKAGEEGGNLSDTLQLIADQMERMYVMKKKIRGALIYPGIIIFAIIGIGVFMMTSVVPSLSATFIEMGVKLPASTQAIIALSNFLVKNTILAAVIAVVVVVGSIAFFRTAFGKRVGALVSVKIPIIGKLVCEVNAARTARTLASLLSSGVDVIGSLEITAEVVQNYYFRAVIKDARQAVSQGEPLSAAFVKREDLYPPFVGEMMAVGEETGALAEMLKRLAIFYEDEVDRATKDMSTIIEPFLMIIIGISVGFFAVSMISPIYSLSSNIN